MPHLLRDLLGADVVRISRILSTDNVLQQAYVAANALVLTLGDERQFELITGQSRTCIVQLSGTRGPFLFDPDDSDQEPDPDEHFSLCDLTGKPFDRAPPLPIRIRQVTEVWAGPGDKAFLVAIMVNEPSDVERSGRLDLCVETDEIEVMTPDEMRDRLKDIEREYEGVQRYSYGMDGYESPTSSS